jgi:DNA processing protein
MRSTLGLLALLSLPRIGPVTALRIALGASELSDALDAQWKQELSRSEAEVAEMKRRGIRALSIFDAEYPIRLRSIHDAPPVLFVEGSVEQVAARRSVAIVGTREPTKFGSSATDEITTRVVDAGWTVVSGLAKGIDTLAHGATLRNQGKTIAVLASGLDHVYPAENKEMARAIVDRGGALVSEHRLGVRPQRSSFVDRNRIQTGLSVALVVAQTGISGGTMHTVRHAAAQGRPIFCVVPKTDHPKNAGLRVLLEEPANRLSELLPAWKGQEALCRRLGDRPLARPLCRENLREFLGDLERLCEEEPMREAENHWAERALRGSGGIEEDEPDEVSLFAFSD